jgi:diguanylate cyclase (GGDEF) domain
MNLLHCIIGEVFLIFLRKKLEYAKRKNKGLTLFFVDIDGMKWINDTLSHRDGDIALKETANILKATFNYNDIIARIGGDEFAIISLESDPEAVDKKIRNLLAGQDALNDTKKYEFKLSFSIGESFFNPEKPVSVDELILKADEMMYRNKNLKNNSDYGNV